MPQIYGKAKRQKPTQSADLTQIQARMTRYGELLTASILDPNMLADEGSFFAAMATPGTPYNLAGATQTAFVATTPTALLYNNEAALGKRYYLEAIRIAIATAGTAGTRIEGAILIDGISRWSSGGTALAIANVNMDDTTTSLAVAYGGAITALAASGSVRWLHRFTLSAAISLAGETFLIVCKPTAVTATQKGACVGPVVIGPTQSLLLYLWSPSQSATPTGEVNLNWWER
jgi:hypothetical protein